MKLENYVHTIFGISYDMKELQSTYQTLKHYRRPTGLYLSGLSKNPQSENRLQSQIKLDSTHVLGDDHLGCDLTAYPAIKNIIDKFAIYIKPRLIDINCFNPNFEFLPHTDQVNCTIMIPIIPDDGGAPINFYFKEGLDPTPATDYRKILTDNDIIFKHKYSTVHPTLINQRQIHGVSKLDHERVYLRFKLEDYCYEELVDLDKTGKLIKS
jgi:hypothetical protein